MLEWLEEFTENLEDEGVFALKDTSANTPQVTYENLFRARLKKPFCVQLVRPSVFHQGGWVGWRVVWERSE